MPVSTFLTKVSRAEEVERNLSTIFQSVRGTRQYLLRSSELKCILREYCPPTLLITLSCAEYDNEHISRFLRNLNAVSDRYPIWRLCTEDPISVSRKFSANFRVLFNTAILNGAVLGRVEHYLYKKEYQARGAPHYHMVLWIAGAPVIGVNNPTDVLNWIQERISCRIPDATLNPELRRLVTKYQLHKCTNCCKRRVKFKQGYITRCPFGYPRDSTECAVLNVVEECLQSRKKIYQLPRSAEEARVNDYNPLLLLLWKAIMDIRFVAESSLALAHYVTGYITKKLKRAACKTSDSRSILPAAYIASCGASEYAV